MPHIGGDQGERMSGSDSIFIYIGTYANEDLAQGDYDIVKDLHWAGDVGAYDAAVITKDEKGKVHVNKDESATRKGAWGGIAVGAVVGLLFPPTIIGSAVIGAAVGGVGGHLWKGMSRSDVKELGEFIDSGEACLLVVGEATIEGAVDKTEFKSDKHVQKRLDVKSADIDTAVKETAKQLS
jgi:uncharacterized membrane protein